MESIKRLLTRVNTYMSDLTASQRLAIGLWLHQILSENPETAQRVVNDWRVQLEALPNERPLPHATGNSIGFVHQ